MKAVIPTPEPTPRPTQRSIPIPQPGDTTTTTTTTPTTTKHHHHDHCDIHWLTDIAIIVDVSHLTNPEECQTQKDFIHHLLSSTYSKYLNVRYSLYTFDCKVSPLIKLMRAPHYEHMAELHGYIEHLDFCASEHEKNEMMKDKYCHRCTAGLDKALCDLEDQDHKGSVEQWAILIQNGPCGSSIWQLKNNKNKSEAHFFFLL